MKEIVTLHYKRSTGELSTGYITHVVETLVVVDEFKDIEWVPMMDRFARALVSYPSAKGLIQRMDHPGLIAMQLSDAHLELFRKDPIEAIRALQVPNRVVETGKVHPKPYVEQAVNPMPPLDAGHGTIAHSFGELVYIRARDLDVECAVCGHWCRASSEQYKCRSCGNSFALYNPHGLNNWQGVRLEDLLWDTVGNRYYLPRDWNPYGKWINRMQLQDMYTEFKKETSS